MPLIHRRRDSGGLLPSAPLEVLRAVDARVKPDFKRAVGAGLLALVCLGVADGFGGARDHGVDHRALGARIAAIVITVAFAAFGTLAVRSAAREVRRIASLRAGTTAGSGLSILVSVVGYLLVIIGVLQLLSVNLGSLLVGGAVTGVVIGIAAQQSLGNFFAGLVLLFARPWVPGQRVKVRTGSLGGPFEGVIIGSGLVYTTIETDDGPVNLPNASLLSSAVGPAPETVDDDADDAAATLADPVVQAAIASAAAAAAAEAVRAWRAGTAD